MKKHFQETFSDHDKIQYWDDLYDRQDFLGETFRQRMNTTLAWLDSQHLPSGAVVLDVGCGAGRPAYEAMKRGYCMLGMDYSFGMLQKANSVLNSNGYQRTPLCQGDIESLPYKDASVDAIICLGVIGYLQSDEKALRELARVLKPGGVLVLSVINKARMTRLLDVPALFKSRLKKAVKGPSHKQFRTYIIPKLSRAMAAAGFQVRGYSTVPYEPITLFGREIFPLAFGNRVTWFFEKFPHIPFIGSVGGMCIFKAEKRFETKGASR